jgi:TPP-dependent pyruvate/acetoin dehydrogenase alpha subunit
MTMATQYAKDFLLELYKTMCTIRRFEELGIRLYRQGHIRGYFHPYWGEEAIATGVCAALEPGDYIVSTHRGHGHCIAWGADLGKMMAELLGKKTGYCKGLGGSMHIADYTGGNLGANGIVGSGAPIGVGAALGSRIRGEDRVSVIFTSDGAASIGSFSEALNLAAIWNLPAIFVLENNQYAAATPVESTTAEPELYKRGMAYGVKSFRIDGNRVLEVYEHAKDCVAGCRKGEGPFLIECVTFRKSGHHVNDPGGYMPAEKVEYYEKHDPLLLGKAVLEGHPEIDSQAIAALEDHVETALEDALEFAKNSEAMSVSEFLTFIKDY